MPGHYGMSFERGRTSYGGAAGTPRQSVADRVASEIAQQQRDSDSDERARAAAAVVQQNLAAAAAAQEAMRQREAQEAAAAVQANLDAAIAQRQREEEQRQAMLVGTPAMGFTDQMMAGGVSPGLLQARYGANAPAVSQYLGQTVPGGLAQGVLGALGMKTAQQHLATGTGQPVMDATGRVRGTLSTGPFGGVVYSGMRIPGYEGEYADLIRPASESGVRVGYNEDEGQPEIVSTVQDPMTGEEKCPDGYIFDEDLQACRLAPMERAAVDTAPGESYIRSGLLDVAPEGLMGFQERYGAGFGSPMDFAAANREFRMGGAVTPSFYSAPPKLDGYTLLT